MKIVRLTYSKEVENCESAEIQLVTGVLQNNPSSPVCTEALCGHLEQDPTELTHSVTERSRSDGCDMGE